MIQELQLGNQVRLFTGIGEHGAEYKHVQVSGIEQDRVRIDDSSYWHPVQSFMPIILTEDILIRCGFTRHKVFMSSADQWQGMDGWSLGDSGWMFRGNLKSAGLRLVGYFNAKIHYLHQLQNLVKLLCNQTIELK